MIYTMSIPEQDAQLEVMNMDIAAALITLLCVVVVVVAIEFSAPIIAGVGALAAAATGVWRAHAAHKKHRG